MRIRTWIFEPYGRVQSGFTLGYRPTPRFPRLVRPLCLTATSSQTRPPTVLRLSYLLLSRELHTVSQDLVSGHAGGTVGC